MKKLLTLLKIHPGEGSKVLRFALLGATLQAGLAIGISCADSLFLAKVGPDKLPYIYMMTPVIMLGYVPIFAYLMNRLGIDRLFNVTLGTLVVGGIGLYLALTPSGFGFYGSSGPPLVVFYITKLYTALWYIALYTLLWNFVDRYFHILDAKRLFSFLSGGMAFGAMIGGGIVTTLIQVIGVRELFLVWSALALAVFPVLMGLQRNCRKITEEEAHAEQETLTFREQAVRILHVLRTSRYANFMILTFLCTLTITTLCEFQYMQIFEMDRTDADIAALFGKLYFYVNAFNLFVNIFLFNRLIALIGIRNTALIQPVVYAIAFSCLLLQGGFGAAVIAFFAYQGILTSIEYNNQNFLFNALPSREKAQVRTFIEGLCEPVATAAAGFFLLSYASRVSPQLISALGLAGAALALCAVFGLRAHYLSAMVENLKKAWLSFSRTPPKSLSSLSHDNLDVLRLLTKSTNRKLALDAISIYWLNDQYTAVDQLLEYLKNTAKSDQKAAKELFLMMLKMQDSTIYRRVLEWLEHGKSILDASLLEICGQHNLLSAEDIRMLSENGGLDYKTAAAVSRWQSWKLGDALETLQATHRFTTGTEEEQVAALHIIGASARSNYVHLVAEQLKNTSPAVQREALDAIRKLADHSSSRIVTDVLNTVSKSDRETRLIGFEALRSIGDPSCVRPLINMSPEFPPCDRRHIEDIILDIGLPCVPILAAMLRDTNSHHTHKAIAARALGMLSFPQFEALAPDLIRSAIESAYRYLISHWILKSSVTTSKSTEFMSSFYRDASLSVIDFVLELLTIAGQLPDFEMLASSLRSDSAKERGDAIETIEQGCSREIFGLLLPLVDASPLESKVEFYYKAYKTPHPSVRKTIITSMASPLPMERAGAIQTAWQLGGDATTAAFNRDETLSLMKQMLLSQASKLVDDVIFALLTEDEKTGRTSPATSLNPVQILTSLSRADFFKSLSILEMDQMISGVSVIEARNKTVCRKGDICDSVHIVLDGTVRIAGKIENVVGKLGLLGAEAIAGSTEYAADAYAKAAVLLRIPIANIIATAEVYPQVAINLFAERLGSPRKQRDPK